MQSNSSQEDLKQQAASPLPPQPFGLDVRRKFGTNYALFAKRSLGSKYAIPSEDAIIAAVVLLPKDDVSHSWLAFEFCTVCLLDDFRTFKCAVLSPSSHVKESSVPSFSIRRTLRSAWRARLVGLWFPFSYFSSYYVGLLAYASIRLKMAPFEPDIRNIVRDLCDEIDVLLAVMRSARRHRAQSRRQKRRDQQIFNDDEDFVVDWDDSGPYHPEEPSAIVSQHSRTKEAADFPTGSSNSSCSNILSTGSSSLRSSGTLSGDGASSELALVSAPISQAGALDSVPLAAFKEPCSALASRVSALLLQIREEAAASLSESTSAELNACLLSLKQDTTGSAHE